MLCPALHERGAHLHTGVMGIVAGDEGAISTLAGAAVVAGGIEGIGRGLPIVERRRGIIVFDSTEAAVIAAIRSCAVLRDPTDQWDGHQRVGADVFVVRDKM